VFEKGGKEGKEVKKYNERGGFVQSTLHTSMKVSQ
jgi:hypothetical protein